MNIKFITISTLYLAVFSPVYKEGFNICFQIQQDVSF